MASDANAFVVKKSDFIDWNYALSVWTSKKTRDQGVAEWNRVVPVYEAWTKSHGALDAKTLDRHPQGQLIRQGHDLNLLYERWGEIYSAWLATIHPKPWNQTTECGVISLMNFFTHECNDLPDWRTPDARARDAKRLADYEAAMAGKGK